MLPLYLVRWMSENLLSFLNMNKFDHFLLIRCLYKTQNNTRSLGDMEFFLHNCTLLACSCHFGFQIGLDRHKQRTCMHLKDWTHFCFCLSLRKSKMDLYTTVIIWHLGNFDACLASFQIQNGHCMILVYGAWYQDPCKLIWWNNFLHFTSVMTQNHSFFRNLTLF